MNERLVSAEGGREDEAIDRAIRPKRLADYVGQRPVKEQLGIFVDAARAPRVAKKRKSLGDPQRERTAPLRPFFFRAPIRFWRPDSAVELECAKKESREC